MGKTNWTDEQLEAITTRKCNLLIAAAAGSGKTAVLVERIIRIIKCIGCIIKCIIIWIIKCII